MATRLTTGYSIPARASGTAGNAVPKAGWVHGLALAYRAATTRHALAEMEPRMLRDIGVSKFDALREHARAPWDYAPSTPNRRGPSRRIDHDALHLGREIRLAWQRFTTRRLLAELSTHDLRDIGISRAEAQHEASKPFWRR